MIGEEGRYLAYMLRLWRSDDAEEATWRASLESAHTRERQGFADLETLFAFLREQTSTSLAEDRAVADPDRAGGGA